MFAQLFALFALAALAAAQCDCPEGTLLEVEPAIQCAFPQGSCVFNSEGLLVNTDQSNCLASIPSFPSLACGEDNTGSEGVLINNLFAFLCALQIDGGNEPTEVCFFNANGDLVPTDESEGCSTTAPLCVA